MELLNRFLTKLPHKTLKYEDLLYLNELLKSDMPLRNSLTLIENKRNKEILKNLIEKLDAGKMIEEVILYYLPKEIFAYIKPLIKKFSFKQSLELSLYFYEKSKENQKKLGKDIFYPIILLFISLSGLYLFDLYGLDSILNLLKSFNVNTTSFSIFRVLIRIVINMIYVVFLLILVMILYFKSTKRIAYLYILMAKYFENSLLKIYYTEEFISLFVICTSLGYKTKDSISILRSLDNKPIISLLAFHMDGVLINGGSMNDALKLEYYDPILSSFIKIAIFSNNFTEVINKYVDLSRMKIKNRIKLYANIVQLFSYLGIGIVIIFVYQVLFLPMQAIGNF